MINEKSILFRNVWIRPILITVALLAISIIPIFFVAESIVATMTRIAIMVLFATSLNLQLGYADMPALGQVMYFGLGAYGFTVLTTRANMSMLPAFLITMLGTLLLATFVGYLCLRSGTIFGFVFLNMGIGVLIWSSINKWMWIGADGGLLNTPRPPFAQSTNAFHIFTITVIAICVIVLYLIRISPFTNMLKGTRENDQRLLLLGVSVKTVKWTAHLISSQFTVIAGVLFAMRNFGAFPTYLNNLLSLEMVTACVIGGFHSFMGPVLGGVIVTIINTSISNQTIYYQLILGVIIILTVFFLKRGILPGPEARLKNKQKKGKSHNIAEGKGVGENDK